MSGTYYDTVRSMTNDPEILEAVDLSEYGNDSLMEGVPDDLVPYVDERMFVEVNPTGPAWWRRLMSWLRRKS